MSKNDGSITPLEIAEIAAAEAIIGEITDLKTGKLEPSATRTDFYWAMVTDRTDRDSVTEIPYFDDYLDRVGELAELGRVSGRLALSERGLCVQPEDLCRVIGLRVCQNETAVGLQLITEFCGKVYGIVPSFDADVLSKTSDIIDQDYAKKYDEDQKTIGNHPARTQAYKPLMQDTVRDIIKGVIYDFDTTVADLLGED